jgi:hypothetical protein
MKKKKVKIICRYCKYFVNSSVRQNDFSGKTSVQYRKCKVKNDFIMEREEACESFELSPNIFCPKNEYWVTPEICVARVSKKYCSKTCKVFKIIEESSNV